jgi:hypothetical protein
MKHIHILQPESDVALWQKEAERREMKLSEFIQFACNKVIGIKSSRPKVGRPSSQEVKKVAQRKRKEPK